MEFIGILLLFGFVCGVWLKIEDLFYTNAQPKKKRAEQPKPNRP